MRRRTIVLLAAGTSIAVGALVAGRFLWRPLPGVELAAVPPLLAPLRTAAEHDALHRAWPYVIEEQRGPGRALVLGIRHTSDADDPQIRELRARLQAFAPTLVLVEGRLGWHFGGRDSLLSRFGESGEAVALAAARGVPCASLEPEAAAEVADAVAAFGRERTLAFYTLRVILSERDHGAWPRDRIDVEAAALLHKRGQRTGLADALPDLGAFEQFWSQQRPVAVDWRELSEEALWRDPDGAWTNQLAERINAFRDRTFVAAIADGMARGERVLAVCGASHAILFEPALRAAIAAAK